MISMGGRGMFLGGCLIRGMDMTGEAMSSGSDDN